MSLTNHASGHAAETDAAKYLVKNGYKLRDINWKTKFCEIDIVAEKNKRIYLVEVKSRRNLLYGTGSDYITRKKLKQMKLAAAMWVSGHKWSGAYQLAVISIDNGEITLIEDIVTE